MCSQRAAYYTYMYMCVCNKHRRERDKEKRICANMLISAQAADRQSNLSHCDAVHPDALIPHSDRAR